jgi:hypothetical protein
LDLDDAARGSGISRDQSGPMSRIVRAIIDDGLNLQRRLLVVSCGNQAAIESNPSRDCGNSTP